ncbi:hypothetical protein [Bacillus sp. AG4(2022)]|uniref:hypothetical protein n=1 Tax=Bacillus sp. AG4(2022) TaxID=2962594 RepID=UPI0028811FD9|nr:hypothetical protein [Bacillus sp. AG4(2022)]MDT0160408.1 hypothetical protein [Bacillus sp. AG4(2022)]
MNIPIEVVRNNKVEEYVELVNRNRELYEEETKLARRHNELLELIHKLVESDHPRSKQGSVKTVYSLGKKRVWSHALTVHEITNELVELAGKLSENFNAKQTVEKELESIK